MNSNSAAPDRGRLRAAWTLVLLVVCCAELSFTAVAVPQTWYLLPLLLVMYGAGVLLITEAVVRVGGGWPSLVLLGVAYELAEDGRRPPGRPLGRSRPRLPNTTNLDRSIPIHHHPPRRHRTPGGPRATARPAVQPAPRPVVVGLAAAGATFGFLLMTLPLALRPGHGTLLGDLVPAPV